MRAVVIRGIPSLWHQSPGLGSQSALSPPHQGCLALRALLTHRGQTTAGRTENVSRKSSLSVYLLPQPDSSVLAREEVGIPREARQLLW